MLVKITCNNCGDVAVFDKDYMTPKRKDVLIVIFVETITKNTTTEKNF